MSQFSLFPILESWLEKFHLSILVNQCQPIISPWFRSTVYQRQSDRRNFPHQLTKKVELENRLGTFRLRSLKYFIWQFKIVMIKKTFSNEVYVHLSVPLDKNQTNLVPKRTRNYRAKSSQNIDYLLNSVSTSLLKVRLNCRPKAFPCGILLKLYCIIFS